MKKIFRTVIMFAFLLMNWSLSYAIITWMNLLVNDYFKSLLMLIAMILLMMVTMWTFSRLAPRRQMDFFTSMIDAMKRISKGDYTIQLANQFEHKKNHPLGRIVDGINEMALELNQIEEMRQEFISNVSHEIQSPLASINGFANVLKQNHLTVEEREHYLGIIETESLRLARLSDNLLKLTSIESLHHPFEPVPYRLDKQLRDILLSCEPQWLAKSLELDVVLDEVIITADKELMSQVWINLIINSIKFTPNEGTLRIVLYQRDNEAIVEIIDTGIGIAGEHLVHLFERFYKTDPSRNRKLSGSGLGLSITKKIIDMHKGSIDVQSTVDEGTMFTVTLHT